MTMPDPIHCPHLPSTGPVYRVQIVQAVTTHDAPVSRYLVCARCHERMRATLPASSPDTATAPPPARWHITETAARCFARLIRDARGHRAPRADDIGETEWQDARAALERLTVTATYRERDRRGRTLWRSPPSAYGLRWVVAPATSGDLPDVIWVGAGRPPERAWAP